MEAYGDYWHCNPKIYLKPKNRQQLKGITKDKNKESYIREIDNGSWNLIILWESDIKENASKCVDKIEKILFKRRKLEWNYSK